MGGNFKSKYIKTKGLRPSQRRVASAQKVPLKTTRAFAAASYERGAAIFALICWIPGLLAMAVGAMHVLFLSKVDAEARHLCRTELLKGQKVSALKLKSILEANRVASQLRASRDAAEAAHAVAPGPAKAATYAALQAVKLEQRLFHLSQLAMIEAARTSANQAALSAVHALRSKNFAAYPHGLAQFPVEASPKNSESPDYHPHWRMHDHQTVTVKWFAQYTNLLPQALNQSNYIKNWADKIFLRGSCSATLEERDGVWIQNLRSDKL